jgi:hypothetical protein
MRLGRERLMWKPKMSLKPRDYLRHLLAEPDYLIGQSAGLSADAATPA